MVSWDCSSSVVSMFDRVMLILFPFLKCTNVENFPVGPLPFSLVQMGPRALITSRLQTGHKLFDQSEMPHPDPYPKPQFFSTS